MEPDRIQEMIDTIGQHPHVPAHVTTVSVRGSDVFLDVRLDYRADTPVCCGEPACYTPFLTTRGLAQLAELLRLTLSEEERPRLHLTVHCAFAPGYRFTQLDMGAPVDWTAVYDYPETAN